MAQAEHDPLATCYLVTFSADYADKVEAAIDEHMKASTRAEITTASLVDQGLIVVCADLPQALEEKGGWGNRATVDAFVEFS
jgi:histidinol dehydrogenase